MRISVKGRNVPVDDELKKRVDKKFAKVARQDKTVSGGGPSPCSSRSASCASSPTVTASNRARMGSSTWRARRSRETTWPWKRRTSASIYAYFEQVIAACASTARPGQDGPEGRGSSRALSTSLV